MVAEPDPNMPCNLLVPSAATGEKPASSSAGIVISPPPPAIESTKPAAKAAAIRMRMVCRVRSIIGEGCWKETAASNMLAPFAQERFHANNLTESQRELGGDGAA